MEKVAAPSVTLIVGCGVSSLTLLMLIIIYVSVWRWGRVLGPRAGRGGGVRSRPFSPEGGHGAGLAQSSRPVSSAIRPSSPAHRCRGRTAPPPPSPLCPLPL